LPVPPRTRRGTTLKAVAVAVPAKNFLRVIPLFFRVKSAVWFFMVSFLLLQNLYFNNDLPLNA